MDLSYQEIKEDMQDSFRSLYQNAGYSAKDTFYATLDGYECCDTFTQTEECCIYVHFAFVLLDHEEEIDFMKQRLYELIDEKYFSIYKSELKEEYDNFVNDVTILKTTIDEVES